MFTGLWVRSIAALLSFLLFAALPVLAEVRSITAIGEYNMSESESLLVAKERAVYIAMRNAVEQAGVYVESYSQINNFQLKKDEVQMIASGIIEITDKKFERRLSDTGGDFVKVTIACRVNTDSIYSVMNKLQDKATLDSLKKLQADYEKAMVEIAALKQQLSQAQTMQDKKAIESLITQNESSFSATQWFEKGYEYQVDKEDYEGAIQYYTRAIQANLRYLDAYYNRGLSHYKREEFDLAIADFNRILAIDSQYADAYFTRGLAYHEKRQFELAIADYTKAVEVNPQDADAYYSRGLVYYEMDRYELAIADCNKAIAIRPQYANAYYNKALACTMIGRNAEAIQAYRLFLQHAPANDPDVEAAKARIMELGGKI